MEHYPTGHLGPLGLPYDLVRELCTLLPAKDIAAFLSTCQDLHSLYQDEAIWQELCNRHGVHEATVLGNHSFQIVYTEMLHTYGPLLGLWASDHPYKGSIIEFRVDTELKGIVGEVWRFWPRILLESQQQPQLPEYFRFMHISLVKNDTGSLHAQLNWYVPDAGPQSIYGPETASIRVPTLHVVSQTNLGILARLPTPAARCGEALLPAFASTGTVWYDHSRELPKLKVDPGVPDPTSVRMYLHAPHPHVVAVTTRTTSPPALMIRPPYPHAEDIFLLHESRLPLHDMRNGIDARQDIGWFYRRFYPLRTLIQEGQDPSDESWRPESLEGLWLGAYGAHGTEVLFLEYNTEQNEILAWKVTGDINVPRGARSWTIDLNSPLAPSEVSSEGRLGEVRRLFRGLGTICATGYIASERAHTTNVVGITGKDEIRVSWMDMGGYMPLYVRYKGRDVASETKEHFIRRPAGWTP